MRGVLVLVAATYGLLIALLAGQGSVPTQVPAGPSSAVIDAYVACDAAIQAGTKTSC